MHYWRQGIKHIGRTRLAQVFYRNAMVSALSRRKESRFIERIIIIIYVKNSLGRNIGVYGGRPQI